jgi:hypothetical protein
MRNFTKFVAVSSLIIGTLAATTMAASASQPPATTSNAKLAQRQEQKVPTAIQTLEDEDNYYSFELQNCQRKGQAVTCSLLITNTDNQERSLLFYANAGAIYGNSACRIFDTSGNEYFPTNAQIGNIKYTDLLRTNLIQGVPIKASFTYKIPLEVKELAAMELKYHDGKNIKNIQFRKINIVTSNLNSVSSNNRKKK